NQEGDEAGIGKEAAALVGGGLLAYAGLIAFLVGLVMGLADLVGPVAGGLIVLAVTGIIAFLLFRYGASKMSALSGDEDERKALAAGEHLT
ncbi:MAG TPA: phage holin family protein, partial [Allosphingosinicella sp.]|nr:phage holin family protein [Allosphingosinicella sp.]